MSYAKGIYKIFTSNIASELIKKLDTKFDFYEIDGSFIISTITDKAKENSYVASFYTLLIDYSKDELPKIDSKAQRVVANLTIKIFANFFKYTQIDKAQILNNYLLSVNFFAKEWEYLDISKLENVAINRYPNYALIIRSVNRKQNPKLFKNLENSGWIPIVIKQVYLFANKEKCSKKRDTKKDMKLLNSKDFIYEKLEYNNKEGIAKAYEFYNELYIKKYSTHNIQFTVKYIEEMLKSNLLTIYMLVDIKKSHYVGVVALSEDEKTITIPMVGYDMSYPVKDALYRRLIIFGLNFAMKKEKLLNLSAGAPEFKRSRGGEAELEYMFVKVSHLPFIRRLGWRVIYFLSNKFYAPMLIRLKL